jgi:hypothetical protein
VRNTRASRRGETAFAWNLPYRTSPFASVRQTSWDTFVARADCWGGVELGMDPTTLKVLSWFSAPTTAERAYSELRRFIDATRADFAAAVSKMLETGLLGLEGLIHPRLIPKVVDKVRLGRPFDGGYVVPADFAIHVDGLLSFGVGDDLSFETDFCDHHPGRVLAFDHTVKEVPPRHSRVDFVPKGVAPTQSTDMVTLDRAVDGVLGRRRSPFRRPMIKMDIEGAEWQVLANCSASVFRRAPVMVFELHGMLANTPLQNLVLDRLLTYHEPIHVHANNNGHTLRVDGQVYPEWLEVTFLHKELLAKPRVDRGAYPTKHDFPNWSEGKDVTLGWWKAKQRS